MQFQIRQIIPTSQPFKWIECRYLAKNLLLYDCHSYYYCWLTGYWMLGAFTIIIIQPFRLTIQIKETWHFIAMNDELIKYMYNVYLLLVFICMSPLSIHLVRKKKLSAISKKIVFCTHVLFLVCQQLIFFPSNVCIWIQTGKRRHKHAWLHGVIKNDLK